MKNILYADDASEDRELMELAFAKSAERLHLLTVHSGETACEYLEGNGPYADRARFPFPDLALLDLKMTGMSGIDVLRWMRRRPQTAGLLAIIYSSSFVDSDIETSYQVGANAFITKPSSWQRHVEIARALQECFQSDPPSLALLSALPEYKEWASRKINLSTSQ